MFRVYFSDDADEDYDPGLAFQLDQEKNSHEEEDVVDPKRVSFVKGATEYTENFRSRFHNYYQEPIEQLPPQTKGKYTLLYVQTVRPVKR